MEQANKQLRYLELVEELRAQIAEGTLAPGTRLPSFEKLKARSDVSQSTVERAYSKLEQEGLIVREKRRGIFVAEPRPAARILTICVPNFDQEGKTTTYGTHLRQGVKRGLSRHGLQQAVPLAHGAFDWEKVDGVLTFRDAPLLSVPPTMPMVNVISPVPGVPSVVGDDFGGAQLAVRHLWELGHRRIGYALWLGRSTTTLRVGGYREALAALGVFPHAGWVRNIWFPGECAANATEHEYGYYNMLYWLREGFLTTECTAILVHNDGHASGVMQALQENGLRVPDDISVIGFDGTVDAAVMQPSLTTVVVPLEEIAEAAVDMLARLIREDTVPRASLVFPLQLRVAQSTGPARHG